LFCLLSLSARAFATYFSASLSFSIERYKDIKMSFFGGGGQQQQPQGPDPVFAGKLVCWWSRVGRRNATNVNSSNDRILRLKISFNFNGS
jgi:hypothetical protein